MKKLLPAIVLLSSSTVLASLAACGGGKDADVPANPASESSETASAAAEPAPPPAETASAAPAPEPAASAAPAPAAPAAPAADTSNPANMTFEDEAVSASATEKVAPKFDTAPLAKDAKYDADAVRSSVRLHAKAIHGCYVKTLKKSATAAGRIMVKLEVDKTGKTTAATVTSSDMNDDALSKCVVGAVSHAKFPKPPTAPAIVNVPFKFTPAS